MIGSGKEVETPEGREEMEFLAFDMLLFLPVALAGIVLVGVVVEVRDADQAAPVDCARASTEKFSSRIWQVLGEVG